ncbi:MAG TPA: hydroxyacid dehydrogenase [Alphaproteobacteria bacterium]|nr:hydroxyacid dehydrogenase [Alphaproteobacteria bacterium]
MKIVVFEAEPREAPAFEKLKGGHDLVLVEAPLRDDNASAHADANVVSTFVYSELHKGVLEKLPSLKLIATRSTGYDHIDTSYCDARGITVSNVPTYGANTVAEHVFALLLAISHRLPEAMERAQRGHFSPEGLEGFDLAGKTLGVIGTGNIGRHVIRIAKGFGMEVVAFDARPDLRFANEAGFRYAEIEELLGASDVITLHVPSLPETRHMLSARAFSHMKGGVVVINTARGDLIDTRALIQELTSGKVTAAGLDVLPDEPMIREEAELICSFFCDQHDLRNLVANHVLLRMRNVIVTPHSAFNTREAVGRIVHTTVGNIEGFLAGAPINVVAGPSATPAERGDARPPAAQRSGAARDPEAERKEDRR